MPYNQDRPDVNGDETAAAVLMASSVAAAHPTKVAGDQVLAYVVPNGYKVATVDPRDHRPVLDRVTGSVKFTDAAGFVAYVLRHKGEGTTLWGRQESRAIIAVLDDHMPGRDTPGWGEHRALIAMRQTSEWEAWQALDGKLVNQVDFAEHLENHALTVVDPDAATMLEIALNFNANRSLEFSSGKRLQDGRTQFTYNEELTATAGGKGELEIPDVFTLRLQLWENGPAYQVMARLRWRIRDGKLAIGYRLDQVDAVVRTAWDDLCAGVAAATGVEVWQGVPR